MKYAKSAPLLLSVALLTGCQSTDRALNTMLDNATAKISNFFSGAPDPEFVKLQQQLAQTKAQLAEANAKLQNNNMRAKSLQREYALLKQEGAAIADTTRHVRVLKQRLSNQSSQLNKLEKTLLDTEASCRAIAQQFASNTTKKSRKKSKKR